MIKDRYGVVNDEKRVEFEKKYQIHYGYEMVTFNYEKAKKLCKEMGEGFVVDKISSTSWATNERQIIYKIG